jgi:hypothetical protein
LGAVAAEATLTHAARPHNGGVKLRTRCANALLLGHDIVMMSNILFFFLQSKE